MGLFWARGYDGVSLPDLLKAMGNISPPSFYAAFGSKDTLFREVVLLYRDSMSGRVGKALMTSPVRDALEAMMRLVVDEFLKNDVAPGCLVILGAVNNTRTSHEAHKLLTEIRCEGSEMIRKRLLKAVDDGELPTGLPISDIAGFYTTVLHGLAIRARDGATRASMLAAVSGAMAAWPALTKPRPTKAKKRA
jgi:AcrR family transcriptional regulator